ncbi:hypothetical protein Tco_1250378 [Tanacetum coccineum]
MFKISGVPGHSGSRFGSGETGYEHGVAGRNLSVVDAYNPEVAKASYINVISIPIHHAGDNTAVGETSMSFALMNVHARAEGAKKHDAALHQLMMEIVSAPLSSHAWVGEASTSVAPLSVEDYDEEDTDEALRSVVAVLKLETCRF